jgi:hypothetical protein
MLLIYFPPQMFPSPLPTKKHEVICPLVRDPWFRIVQESDKQRLVNANFLKNVSLIVASPVRLNMVNRKKLPGLQLFSQKLTS